MADLKNSKWPPQKNLIFKLCQFSIFYHEIFTQSQLRLVTSYHVKMSVLFLCLPLLQEFSTLQSQNGTIYNAPYDLYPNLNVTMRHGWQVTSTRIKACKDYQQCPWHNLETLPSQAFLESDASQSEVTKAKEKYLAICCSSSNFKLFLRRHFHHALFKM